MREFLFFDEVIYPENREAFGELLERLGDEFLIGTPPAPDALICRGESLYRLAEGLVFTGQSHDKISALLKRAKSEFHKATTALNYVRNSQVLSTLDRVRLGYLTQRVELLGLDYDIQEVSE